MEVTHDLSCKDDKVEIQHPLAQGISSFDLSFSGSNVLFSLTKYLLI